MCARARIFWLKDTATTEIYTLSLHDALPILVTTTTVVEGRRVREYRGLVMGEAILGATVFRDFFAGIRDIVDRKSTRLNSSHANIWSAVFCLKPYRARAPSRAVLRSGPRRPR